MAPLKPVVICLGGSKDVWDELDKARSICEREGIEYDIAACNEAGIDYDGYLILWATLHPDKFCKWQDERDRKGRRRPYKTASHKRFAKTRIDIVAPEVFHGSSGLFVCKVALLNMVLPYRAAIACGMPMNEDNHYHSSQAWVDGSKYHKGWIEAHGSQELCNRIRTMSGWTMGLMGYPDAEWLQQVVEMPQIRT